MMAGIIAQVARGAGAEKIFGPAIAFNMVAMGNGGGTAVGVKRFAGPPALLAAFFALVIGFDLDRFG